MYVSKEPKNASFPGMKISWEDLMNILMEMGREE
jgi:hypothetical protein